MQTPWKLRPNRRLYLDLDNCFVNVYNRVKVGPDGVTGVNIEARGGYEILATPVQMGPTNLLEVTVKRIDEPTASN